ncbi:hypothetical protein A3J20_02485 [Candidatus Gottesmanbacteria bacterium RIFCSPLOWO2_02_FULL_42_29]|nr:MAG: hypothetical protein A3J20_02485 [Candidatus Gottesmanbacteria bacterium RIFCSPLOWO2_02_FULL_42_29]
MILTPQQETILDIFAGSGLSEKFYWTGGTLLSHYYLKHRYSYDLDFFSDSPFSYQDLANFLTAVKKSLKIEELEEVKIHDRWEFVIHATKPEIRFEFVHYNHEKKRLAKLIKYRGLLIDSLPDMAANKTMALIDRNHSKDLYDVYILLKRKKFTVPELLTLVHNKFGVHFDDFIFWSECAKALKKLPELKPYFTEKSEQKQGKIIKDVRSFFLEEGANYLSKRIG